MSHIFYSTEQRVKLTDLGCTWKNSIEPSKPEHLRYTTTIVHELTQKPLLEAQGETAQLAFDAALARLDATMLPLTEEQTRAKLAAAEAENAALKSKIAMIEKLRDRGTIPADDTPPVPAPSDADEHDAPSPSPPLRGRGKKS